MNRYSKIKLIKSTKKSRSIDFSDLQSFPRETTKPIKPQDINFNTQEPEQQTNAQKFNDSPPNLEENDELANTHRDKKFGTVKLNRNSSVSAATTNSSSKFKLEKQSTSALQSAVKRAFSMRRSSSVSERYCKIHDQCVTVASPFDDDDDDDEEIDDDENNTMHTRSMNMMMMKKKKKKQRYSSGRILKACKRLFGL